MYQLYNGDSLEGLKELDSNTFDLALIDPPYFDYQTNYRKDKETKLSQNIAQQSREDQIMTISECIRVLKSGGAFFVFTNWENIYWIQEPFKSFFRNMIIWDKGNRTAGSLKDSLGNQYEVAFLGSKAKGWEYRGTRISDIWPIARQSNNRIHPTEKPVDLYKQCIHVASDSNCWIIDPYAGSGSSIIAALELNCNIVAWEIDKYYHDLILERINGYKSRG